MFISSYLAKYVKTNRVDGYLQAMRENTLSVSSDRIIQLDQGASLINAETAIVDHLNKGNKVDGVVCTSDNQAIGCMAGLKRMGLRIPEDVKVFGFDNQFRSRICTPTLSTIEREPVRMGKTAADLLLKPIRNKKEDLPHETILKCRLIERGSTDKR